MLTGGIPPGVDMPCSAETAYRALFQRVLTQNAKYYKRFPGDITLVQRIVQVIDAHPDGGPTTPCGNRLSVRCAWRWLCHVIIHDGATCMTDELVCCRCHSATKNPTPQLCCCRLFLTLGLGGLGSFGGFERLHYLLERAFDGQPAESASEISYSFLKVQCCNMSCTHHLCPAHITYVLHTSPMSYTHITVSATKLGHPLVPNHRVLTAGCTGTATPCTRSCTRQSTARGRPANGQRSGCWTLNLGPNLMPWLVQTLESPSISQVGTSLHYYFHATLDQQPHDH